MSQSLGGFWRPQGVAYQRELERQKILEEHRAKWREHDKQIETRAKERRRSRVVTKAEHLRVMLAQANDITDLVNGLNKP